MITRKREKLQRCKPENLSLRSEEGNDLKKLLKICGQCWYGSLAAGTWG